MFWISVADSSSPSEVSLNLHIAGYHTCIIILLLGFAQDLISSTISSVYALPYPICLLERILLVNLELSRNSLTLNILQIIKKNIWWIVCFYICSKKNSRGRHIGLLSWIQNLNSYLCIPKKGWTNNTILLGPFVQSTTIVPVIMAASNGWPKQWGNLSQLLAKW